MSLNALGGNMLYFTYVLNRSLVSVQFAIVCLCVTNTVAGTVNCVQCLVKPDE